MPIPRSKRLLLLFTLLLAMAVLESSLAPAADAEPSCNGYNNSSIVFFFGYGWACAGSGPGCRECVELGSMGYTVCVESGTRSFCYDYQY